ncbi:glycosyl hydrolase [Podospora australis]|uniref:Glycosyl hydrolase n=1 Tax=Podospora australis TaxID=1536484 RepID=A0AAN6WPA5_9PEZI|nr:glycosyl hydrolase [Podospora australis]
MTITNLLLLPLLSLLLPFCLSAPHNTLGNLDFPDPSVTFDPLTRKFYAFATESHFTHVQVASSPSFGSPPGSSASSSAGSWTYLPIDLLPTPGAWVNQSHPQIWAPDIHFLPSSQSWVMYYSALLASSPYHCIGTAISSSSSILGPYIAHSEPFACPSSQGGAIDASGLFDNSTGTPKRFVIYKVDGSAKGPGGPCGNGFEPGFPTPFLLQEVDPHDGFTKIGEPTEVLDRLPGVDGPLIEAPRGGASGTRGKYVLFYSSHCFNTPGYDIKYAVAENITGPYERKGQLMGGESESFGFRAPGGASAVLRDKKMMLVFHADCAAGRCMYETEWRVVNGSVVIVA